MESNGSNKQRRSSSLCKLKLVMSIYRATKPSSAAIGKPNMSHSSLDEPKLQAPPAPKSSAGSGFIIVNHQDQLQVVYPQPKPTVVAFVRNRPGSYGRLENFYEDEAVDAKADKYISNVQERFKLECVNSERIKLNAIPL